MKEEGDGDVRRVASEASQRVGGLAEEAEEKKKKSLKQRREKKTRGTGRRLSLSFFRFSCLSCVVVSVATLSRCCVVGFVFVVVGGLLFLSVCTACVVAASVAVA